MHLRSGTGLSASRVRTRLRTAAACVALLVAMLTASTGGSNAASSGVTVQAEVVSATRLDVTGCPASARRFGTVVAGSAVVTPDPCSISFGATSSGSTLRMYQLDGGGDAMYAVGASALDEEFDDDGTMTFSFPGGSVASSAMLQRDGKPVIVGSARPTGDADIAVVRLLPDGTPDPLFGEDGQVVHELSATDDESARAVVEQPDGKLLVVGRVGYFSGLNGDVAIMRLHPNGDRDLTFGGGDGIVIFNVQGNDTAVDVHVHRDRIWVAGIEGIWNDAATQDGFIARLHMDGSIDASWGTNGILTVDLAPGRSDRIVQMTPLSTGKWLLNGTINNGSDMDLYTARLNADGSLDPSYGTGGVTVLTSGPGVTDSSARSQVDPSSGVALIAGYQGNLAGPAGFVHRVLGDGTPDPDWGTDGMVLWEFDPSRIGSVYGIWSPDMRTVHAVGADQGVHPDKDWHVATISPTGTVTRLGTTGRVDFHGEPDYGNMLFEGRDGQVWGIGSTLESGTEQMGIIRLAAAGASVPDYGDGGTAVFGPDDETSAFGACMESRSGSGVTGGWVPRNGACTTVPSDPWNPIADGPADPTAIVLGSPTPGVIDATANIRFGLKAGMGLAARDYAAPLRVEVIAP